MHQKNILEDIHYPKDLKKLSKSELHQLADELRTFILNNVSKTGGHLASNLGCVELTVALHYVYDTPNDKLVWDVGHQSYPHKILTGRREQMDTLRQTNGLAGFPKREESEYDTFGVGHSSTSISAALGMAVGNRQRGKTDKVVAIIGDGSMTAGLAFEGLNNAGWLNTDMLVILNDNEMSISENVGAVSTYLSKILAGRFYNKVKDTANKALSVVPSMQKLAHKVEEHMKGMIMPSTMFEELGFNYIGPIDGHDLDQLIDTLTELKNLSGPQFLHIVTKKGQGYKLAENDPIAYHGVSTFNPTEGMQAKASAMTYTQVFGKFLCDIAKLDDEFLAITPAMREGSGMVEFAKEYPEKFFDVGIAEQHAVTFAAGVATQGIKPIVAIYSTFLQRGYDQLIHDVALQNLPVLFAIDRAGIVGADGPTHNGAFDISFLRCIPSMIIMTPSDENECYQMLYTGFRLNAPVAVRYPRGSGIGRALEPFNNQLLEVGKGRVLRSGKRIAFLAFGSMVHPALDAANEIDATICDMRFVKPLDRELIKSMVATHDVIVTVEENAIMGGAGSACAEAILEIGLSPAQVITIGIPDEFIDHGDPKAMLGSIGLNKVGILEKLRALNVLNY